MLRQLEEIAAPPAVVQATQTRASVRADATSRTRPPARVPLVVCWARFSLPGLGVRKEKKHIKHGQEEKQATGTERKIELINYMDITLPRQVSQPTELGSRAEQLMQLE